MIDQFNNPVFKLWDEGNRVKSASLHFVGCGVINNIDTSKFNIGEALYLSDKPGCLTDITINYHNLQNSVDRGMSFNFKYITED